MTMRHPLTAFLSVAVGAAAAASLDESDVLAWYEGWVASHPEAAAVESTGRVWTYRELDRLARGVEETLSTRVEPGAFVGVCLDRSALLVAVAVAIARLGGVYVPFGPRPAPARLTAVAADAGIACLVTGGNARLPDGWSDVPVEVADADVPRCVAGFSPDAGGRAPTCGIAGDPFYGVLTSGTTGLPKLVVVGRPSFANLLRWYTATCALGPGKRAALITSVTFDPHLMELWSALGSGTTLCVTPEEVRLSGAALIDWWAEHRITACFLATPVGDLVLDRDWPTDLPLEHLMVGGDRMRRWPPAGIRARVHNLYGPAEATVGTTAHTVDRDIDDMNLPVPIGRPLPGVLVCVTDEDGEVVARGEPGELRVGGRALALGYVDRELTARRFVQQWSREEPAAPPVRVYRTGDRVRMRPDGVLEFLGRFDDQVKVSGVRVEPAEVEAALERDALVGQAVVVPIAATGGDKRLVAFVSPAGEEAPDPTRLLRLARQWLPEQAVPASAHVVDRIPLTSNGKVDRRALAARLAEAPAPVSSGEPDGARSSETLVLEACRDLLGTPGLGPTDNFLEAGGNSMLTAHLLVAIEKGSGVRLRAVEVLRQPDLAALAALVQTRRHQG